MNIKKKGIKLVALLSAVSAISMFSTGCNKSEDSVASSDITPLETLSEGTDATTPTDPDQELRDVIDSAIKGLAEYSEDYMVSASISMPSETTYYLEVNDSNGSYTQYSMDDSGALGKVSYEAADNTNFMLFDWITPDGKGYLVNQNYTEGENSQWLVLPLDYSKNLLDRKVLYLNKLQTGMSNFEKDEVIQVDLGNGDVDLQLYNCTISSDVVAEVLGIDTLGLYQAISSESKTKNDASVTELMDKYISELEMNLVFSDAKATIGVNDGVVRYLKMEVGGLGSRMTSTKVVLDSDSSVSYDTPDFSSQEAYYTSVKELADYVAEYDTYEDAMNDLYGTAEGVSPKVEETTEKDSKSDKKDEDKDKTEE